MDLASAVGWNRAVCAESDRASRVSVSPNPLAPSQTRRFVAAADGWTPPDSTIVLAAAEAERRWRFLPRATQPRLSHLLLPRLDEKDRNGFIYLWSPLTPSLLLSLSRNLPFFSERAPPLPLQIRPPPSTSGNEVWCGVLLELRRSR